jgi:hypothetical protein
MAAKKAVVTPLRHGLLRMFEQPCRGKPGVARRVAGASAVAVAAEGGRGVEQREWRGPFRLQVDRVDFCRSLMLCGMP